MSFDLDGLSMTKEIDALSVADLYDELEIALNQAFPRTRSLWVRGEIQSISDQSGRSGHCYFDLIDPDSVGTKQPPSLKVKCWRSTWTSLKASLVEEGITLAPGSVVVIRGTLDFYRPKAEIGFVLSELDVTALLGRLAAQRAALLKALSAEGLLERNKQMKVPELALRIGLVASPNTEGYRDFLGQLSKSGFTFFVQVAPVVVQGAEAPMAVARGIEILGNSDCDLIVVVRGGGSKADLAAFDTEPVARAIATSRLPVWSGIGHTGDESVADLVANAKFITPTECGYQLALRAARWWQDSVGQPSSTLLRRADEILIEAARKDTLLRGRLSSISRQQLRLHLQRLIDRVEILKKAGPSSLDIAEQALTNKISRFLPLVDSCLEREAERINSWNRLIRAYDVERQLERGYTLTLDSEGHSLRDIGQIHDGMKIVTRFHNGSVGSTVESVISSDRDERGIK